MLQLAIGHAEGIDTEALTAQVLEQCEAQLAGVPPRLGLLFCSGDFVHQRILDAILERFPSLDPGQVQPHGYRRGRARGQGLIGCTSRANLSSLAGFHEDAINLVLIASDTVSVGLGLGRNCSRDPAAAIAEALAQARTQLGVPERVCIIFPDITCGEPGDLVQALDQKLGFDCALFGGGAARPWGLTPMPIGQFFGREIVSDALPLLLLGGAIDYSHIIENGWRPIGGRQKVSQVQGRVVGRIGDMPALDYHHHYLGRHSRPLAEFPLAVFENPTDEHYYLRIPDTYNAESGTVTYIDKVPDGATVRLTEVQRPHLFKQIDASLGELAGTVSGIRPLLGLAFSCSARRSALGSQVAREAEALKRHLGTMPLVGFYGFAEIAPIARGRSSFLHQATLVTLVLHAPGDEEVSEPRPSFKPQPTVARASGANEQKLLKRELARSEFFRVQLERRHDQSCSLLHTIHAEIEESRRLIAKQNQELRRLHQEIAVEKKKTDDLLLNILPSDVADELKKTGQVKPVYYDSVTVLFTDFKGFTSIAGKLTPKEVLQELDHYFSAFDAIIERHDLEKLKTIGDAYMCAGGLPIPSEGHALAVVRAAWEMQAFMAKDHAIRKAEGRTTWALRVGINTGPLMAGVIGKKKFAYDIWGDTVNIASRLESGGEANRVNISRTTWEQVKDHFECTYRGKIPVKNAGEIDMYFVDRPK